MTIITEDEHVDTECEHMRYSEVAWPCRIQENDWCTKCGLPMPWPEDS
jgi:hypothetical protein